MRKVRADLHLHTCLSPCADNQMRTGAIIEQAKKVGLDMIGICDHNSAENVSAVMKAGKRLHMHALVAVDMRRASRLLDNPQAIAFRPPGPEFASHFIDGSQRLQSIDWHLVHRRGKRAGALPGLQRPQSAGDGEAKGA